MAHATGRMSIPQKILLPIDFSSSYYAALEAAAELARQFRSELYLLHIIAMLPADTGPEFFEETAVLQRTRDHAEQQLTVRVHELYEELGREEV